MLLDINTFVYGLTRRVVSDLEHVLLGKIAHGYEWAGMRTEFESNQEVTIVSDTMSIYPDVSFNTRDLYVLLSKRKNFQESMSFKRISKLVSDSFTEICKDPDGCRVEGNRYQYLNEDILMQFVLLPEDFGLKSTEFMKQVQIMPQFLAEPTS